jgi:23S rRNA (cytosine1962-C5)-methyltransferase
VSTPLDKLQHAIQHRSSINPAHTTAYRLINDAGDGFPGIVVDRYNDVLLIQSQKAPASEFVDNLAQLFPQARIYHKMTSRFVRSLDKADTSPTLLRGNAVHSPFPILENNVTFLVSMEAGYSTGIFLDQRSNRQAILDMNLQGKAILNTFAYTCAFSVCAALAGATVTSLDLSKKYLEWGRENFRTNKINDTAHDFIFGDVFDWLPRLIKKGRRWDMIILDPPTFSTSKSGQAFKATRDYPKLLSLAQSGLAPNGRILACMNTHEINVAAFKQLTGIQSILPLSCDFSVAAGEDPHLKSGWIDQIMM